MKERIAAAVPGWAWTALKMMGWCARVLVALSGAGLSAGSAYLWLNPIPDSPLIFQRVAMLMLAGCGMFGIWAAWGDDGLMPRLHAVLRDVGVAARDRMIAVVWIAMGGWALAFGGYSWISMLDPADSGEIELSLFGMFFATFFLIGGPYMIHEALKDLDK